MYYIYIIFESKMCFSKFYKKFYKSKSIICHLERLFQCLLKADNSQQFFQLTCVVYIKNHWDKSAYSFCRGKLCFYGFRYIKCSDCFEVLFGKKETHLEEAFPHRKPQNSLLFMLYFAEPGFAIVIVSPFKA